MTAEPTRKLVPHIAKLVLPMAGTRMIAMLSGFIGMLMVAQLGHVVLAASALILTAQVTPFVIVMSILFAISVMTSQLYGAKDHVAIAGLCQQGCVLGLILSVVLGVLYWFMGPIYLIFGQKPELVVYVSQYFHIFAWISPLLILSVCIGQVCYGILKQRVVMWVNILGLLTFLPVAYAFIYGHFGAPRLGVGGLAVAAVVQFIMMNIAFLFYFLFANSLKCYSFFRWQGFRKQNYLKQLFQIGWPMSVQFGGELLTFFVISVMVGWLGVNELAAWQIVQQCLWLVLVPIFSVSEAVGILVGHEIGAKQYFNVKKTANVCIMFALTLAFIVMVLFFAIPKQLAGFYMNVHNPDYAITLQLTEYLFYAMAFLFCIDTMRSMLSGALRGLFDTRYAMWVSLIFGWLFNIPVGYILAFHTHLGVVGFTMAMIFGFGIGTILMYRHWLRRIASYSEL